jgi:hypothetical protein
MPAIIGPDLALRSRSGGATASPPTSKSRRAHVRLSLFGYTEDCLIRGSFETDGGRPSDLLARNTELRLEEVTLESLDDGHLLELVHLTIATDELYLAEIGGPRGDPHKRVRAVAQRLIAVLGPYRLSATLHTPPAAAPLAGLLRRPAMVPMTDALVEFDLAGRAVRREHAVVVVNRDRISSLLAAYAVQDRPFVVEPGLS